MGTSTDTTGYGTGEFGATLAKVTDRSHSPHPGSARVDVGEKGVVSMGVMGNGCNEDGEEGVTGCYGFSFFHSYPCNIYYVDVS